MVIDVVYLNLATQNHPQEQGRIAWAGGELSLWLSAPTATRGKGSDCNFSQNDQKA